MQIKQHIKGAIEDERKSGTFKALRNGKPIGIEEGVYTNIIL